MPSASNYTDVVQSLYIAYFGQPADSTGLANFENALAAANAPTSLAELDAAYSANAAITTLIDSFGTSAASVALYGDVDTEASALAFVNAIFENGFNHPSVGAVTFYVGSILNGTMSLGNVALQIIANAAPDDAATLAAKVLAAEEAACYCRGTLIRTLRGKQPIEALAIGDLVVTHSGEPKPIKWIGRRSYDGRFIRGKRDVLPIVIAAGALRRGVPARDLWVSPGHALFIDDLLVPAQLLVNGLTIVQAESVERVDYFHLEFEGHEIIFAEGTPAESYVESNNRRSFHNADEFCALYPDDDRPAVAEYAPRVTREMPVLGQIRQKLFDRAEVLGFPVTDDPDLHLIADGEIVRPVLAARERATFTLHQKPQELWLASRSAVPAELELMSTDTRRLGVGIDTIVLCDHHLRVEISHAHPALSDGFHENEGPRRWTDGLARLPADLFHPFPGPLTLTIHRLDAKLRYPRRPVAQAQNKATATQLAAATKAARA